MTATDSQLLATLERRNRELATLLETAKALTSTLSLADLLQRILEKVGLLLRSQSWSLQLVDEETGDLCLEIAVPKERRGRRLARGEGVAGWVAEQGVPLLLRKGDGDPRFAAQLEVGGIGDAAVIACVPVRIRDRMLGVVELVNGGSGEGFDAEDLAILAAVADFVAIAIANARQVEQISRLTIIDDLTGLYNDRHLHALLTYEMERAGRYAAPLSLVFIDLDHFKQVNDTWGHLIGSRILRETGQLIQQVIRRVDFAARYGGDEFVVILPSTSKAGALVLAEKLRQRIGEHPFCGDTGTPVRVTASFGVATFPEDGIDKQQLINRADLAMYRAKDAGRNNVLGS